MDEKRALQLKSFSRYTSKPINIQSLSTGEIRSFSSIIAVVRYLKDNNIKADRNKISKCLVNNDHYLGYKFFK